MRKPTDDEAIEIGLLSFRINYWLFWCGMFFGMAMKVGVLMLLFGSFIPQLALFGVFYLMAALAVHQYRNSLKERLQELVQKINGA